MLIFYNGIKNLMNHFDFKFNIFAVVSLFIMILFVPWVISLMPVSFGYENGLIENIQMFILFLRPEKGFVISVKYNTPFSSNYSIYFGYAALFSGEMGAAFLSARRERVKIRDFRQWREFLAERRPNDKRRPFRALRASGIPR